MHNDVITLTYDDLCQRAAELPIRSGGDRLYGIPNGGTYAAMLVNLKHPNCRLVESPADATVLVDDIIDSGVTRDLWESNYPGRPFVALIDKQGKDLKWLDRWVVLPWENAAGQTGPEDSVRRLLQYVGENPSREGLLETPKRVIKAYDELCAGYRQNVADVFKVFEDGACDEMVLLKSIPFDSLCEHHLLGFSGQAHIGYIPDKRIVGISKLARVLDVFARRLQVQERLTTQVTQALDKHLQPKGSACVLQAVHSCLACRGVKKHDCVLVTSSLTGAFRDEPATRAEFFQLIRD